MHIGEKLAFVAMGVAAGIGLVLSCNGDSPTTADAASCECPAAEAPLSRDRYQIVNNTQTIEPDGRGGTSAACPEDTLFIAGSCTTAELNPVRNLTLEQSGFYSGIGEAREWHCRFKNNEATPVEIKASVICLAPAP